MPRYVLTGTPGAGKTAILRQLERAAPPDGIVFFDRSPVCTLALSRYFGRPPSALLAAEVERVLASRVFEQAVFFVRCPGFVTPTAARRISLPEALAFEKIHAGTYTELGFRLIDVPAGPLADRAALVRRTATALGDGSAPV